ncbi:hypothetical protein SAMN02745243_01277 [Hespellia stercorisuis DSM 15480]|uniref:Uncharacterized protein n=1 Tax=Hespellia stercorisuis DSM 15480 TaxID=1121950 RepID=A0A1M6LVR2_9FIRM|nr:hypothetical protein SAMN02745243_01277 [Hespellia stercorisuis DSM 15480]
MKIWLTFFTERNPYVGANTNYAEHSCLVTGTNQCPTTNVTAHNTSDIAMTTSTCFR